MNEADLLGYALDALSDEEHRSIESQIRENPHLNEQLRKMRAALAPLGFATIEPEPPTELALDAIHAVARLIVQQEGSVDNPGPTTTAEQLAAIAIHAEMTMFGAAPMPAPSDRGEANSSLSFRQMIAALLLVGTAALTILPAIQAIRQRAAAVSCQAKLQELGGALATFSTVNEGRYPTIEENQRADAFVNRLKSDGLLRPDFQATCPTHTEPERTASNPHGVDYAYALGYRTTTGLQGPSVTLGGDYALLADAPRRTSSGVEPRNHPHGHHVLFIGGNVRFCTHAKVGIDGDDIFYNDNNRVAAGVRPTDTVLGAPGEAP